jgi:hypothetical protein
MKRFLAFATAAATSGLLLGCGLVGAAGAASAHGRVPNPGGRIVRGNQLLPDRAGRLPQGHHGPG